MKQAGRCSLKEHGWGFLLRTRRTSCQHHRLRLCGHGQCGCSFRRRHCQVVGLTSSLPEQNGLWTEVQRQWMADHSKVDVASPGERREPVLLAPENSCQRAWTRTLQSGECQAQSSILPLPELSRLYS